MKLYKIETPCGFYEVEAKTIMSALWIFAVKNGPALMDDIISIQEVKLSE